MNDTDSMTGLPSHSARWAKPLFIIGAVFLLFLPVLGGVWLARGSYSSPALKPGDALAEQPGAQTGDGAGQSKSRIEVMRNGQPISLPNGGMVDLGDGLKAEVFLTPYPPAQFSADLDLYLTDANGQPVTDAVVNLEYDMLYMSHGQSRATTRNQKDGHYLSALNYEMFGPWALDAKIELPGHAMTASLLLVIYVWP